jgi:hypothetical protein
MIPRAQRQLGQLLRRNVKWTCEVTVSKPLRSKAALLTGSDPWKRHNVKQGQVIHALQCSTRNSTSAICVTLGICLVDPNVVAQLFFIVMPFSSPSSVTWGSLA